MVPALPVLPRDPIAPNPLGGPALRAARQPEILVLFPTGLEDGQLAVEAVRNGRNVLLNASALEPRLGQRLVDFTCGGVSAMEGRSHRIGEAVFLFTAALSRVERNAGPG
jgi:FtsZ-interacting cell division protein YlmF